jgi:hypothetical protein
MKSVGLPRGRFPVSFRWPMKNDMGINNLGVYSMPCGHGILHFELFPSFLISYSSGLPLPPFAPLLLSSPDPHHLPHLSRQGSALTDLFLYLSEIFCAQLTHHPDDGGSDHI